MTLKDLKELVDRLSPTEKSLVLQWITGGLSGEFPGIERDPAIAGDEPRIVRTRIPVWLLVQARRLGSSDADLLRAYPSLLQQDLANAWAYARLHMDEIEAQIRENESA